MAARNSSSSYQLRTMATLLTRYTTISNGGSWRRHHRYPPPYSGRFKDQGLSSITLTSKPYLDSNFRMENGQIEEVQVQQTTPFPSKFVFSKWMKWVLGSLVSVLLPFWKNKWDTLLTLEGEAEKVVEEVEVVVEVVEKVATTAEKVAEVVLKQLPDNSKIKEAAQVVEHVSSVAAHNAQLIQNLINKVDDVKQDVEELEKIVEPIVDKMIHTGN
ncbi:hypothetical protein ACS0TY_011632 [Phlomoides rotata]